MKGMTPMLHLMMIEVSPLMMLVMRRNQNKSLREKRDAKKRDQLKRMRRSRLKSKKNSLRSSVSKKTSHNLKMVSEMRRAMRRKKKPKQQQTNELVINLINFTLKC
jgi:hypothetical protein